jgi:methylmalonyl-CoA mutase N-terminal domain/subunit
VQHAVTSSAMMTERDPWVNMLRTTVACLAAGVGGADAVTVLPFDAALGLPDDFSRRIARNTQAILLEESHLAQVIDPAGGSWYVESLTDELARAAWAWFQEIERAGGQWVALRSGLVGDRLAATAAKRAANLAKRREPITGVSEFPNLAEQPVVRDPAPAPASGGLPRIRRAEQFERLRTRSDAHLAATGRRPKLVLAAIGPAAVYTARSWHRLPRDLARHRALSARPLPDDVCQPALDHPAICRLLDRRGFQRLLPRNLAAGQKGLSVAFDLATHRGYDSDHPRVVGDVGMAGVAIDSIYDMRTCSTASRSTR